MPTIWLWYTCEYIHLESLYILLLLGEVFYKCQLGQGVNITFISSISLLIFDAVVLPVAKTELKTEIEPCLFLQFYFCFMYFDVLLLGIFTFMFVMSS